MNIVVPVEDRQAFLEHHYGVRKPIPAKELRSDFFEDVLLNLETYGFEQPQVGRIIALQPQVLLYSLSRTDRILQNLETQGLNRREIILMVSRHPALIGCTPERTNDLIALFLELDYDFVSHPLSFIWSAVRLRRRMALMREAGRDPSQEKSLLFQSPDKFAARVGCSEEAEYEKTPT